MPSLALAQKLLSKASQAGVSAAPAATSSSNQGISAETDGDVPGLDADSLSRRDARTGLASEAELGDALLALVATARANGWDAERALRERLRRLEREIRAAEGTPEDLER
jgi:XTP/dITP diphosphohydrolase